MVRLDAAKMLDFIVYHCSICKPLTLSVPITCQITRPLCRNAFLLQLLHDACTLIRWLVDVQEANARLELEERSGRPLDPALVTQV